jgi:hypothetical protein
MNNAELLLICHPKDKANELIKEWKQSAVTQTHIRVEYGRPDTWGLMYNLFPAVWLQTDLIDEDVRFPVAYIVFAPHPLHNGADFES